MLFLPLPLPSSALSLSPSPQVGAGWLHPAQSLRTFGFETHPWFPCVTTFLPPLADHAGPSKLMRRAAHPDRLAPRGLPPPNYRACAHGIRLSTSRSPWRSLPHATLASGVRLPVSQATLSSGFSVPWFPSSISTTSAYAGLKSDFSWLLNGFLTSGKLLEAARSFLCSSALTPRIPRPSSEQDGLMRWFPCLGFTGQTTESEQPGTSRQSPPLRLHANPSLWGRWWEN